MNEIKFFVLIIETNSQIKVPENIKKIEKLENAFNAKKIFYRTPQFNCCVVVNFCVIAHRLITHGITLNNPSTTGVASGATDVRDLEMP